ncbi:MAG TPA: hypothetical protein VNH46_09850, partial [Gemmatimonadales bacterium]|nr:hypothetical protein [Gemmatimonadales bacterium]
IQVNTAVADGYGACADMAAVSSTVGFGVVGAPSSVTALAENQQVTLDWASAALGYSPLSRYEVFRATCATCAGTQIGFAWGGATRYTDTGLVNTNWYYYQVRAKDQLGDPGVFSKTASGKPLDTNLNPPACFSIAQRGGSNAVDISWCFSPPATHPATGYAVYRSTFYGYAGAKLLTVGNDSTSWYLDDAPAAGSYWYFVRAFGSVSDPSPLSASVYVTANPPTAPTGLTAIGQFESVQLNWVPGSPGSAPSNPILGYRVYRATYVPGPGTPVYQTLLGAAVSSFLDTNVEEGQTYYYTVDCYDTAGPPANESGNSNLAFAIATSPLVTSLVVKPATTVIGASPVEVHLLIQNVGPNTVNNLMGQAWESSNGTVVNGPLCCPNTGPLTLFPGTSTEFVWTYSPVNDGPAVFSLTISGQDAVTTYQVTGRNAGAVTVGPLRASLTMTPLTAAPDGFPGTADFEIHLTVTNVGSSCVNPFWVGPPAAPWQGGSAGLSLLTGPTPAPPALLNSGESQTFTWTYDCYADGTVAFSITVAGSDCLGGA